MISQIDVYHVVAAIIPLYVAMILAYISVKWLKLFTPEQSSGINKFVAKFSIPLLSFQVISTSNPYKMNLKLVCADFLQKFIAIAIEAVMAKFHSEGNLKWVITGFSLSTLPNTLILGIPLLKAMYGDEAALLLAQIVVLQSIIWYNILLILFEVSAVKETYAKASSDATGELEAPQDTQENEEWQEVQIRTTRKTKVKHILLTVGRKLATNPNTHATVVGVIWASISFRYGVKLPKIVDKSISILADGGLGMAMFSLGTNQTSMSPIKGLFMASQTSIIACGYKIALLAMAMKFLVGPATMAASSSVIGLREDMFRITIIQAALPQGIVPFVFAKEYNIHPDILSTGVLFGLIIALPIALGYYFLLTL